MLFGRVHAAQRSLLSRMPFLSASELKTFLGFWMDYAAYAIDAYVQRQQILNKSKGLVPKVYKSHIGSRVLVAREVMRGIEPTTLLHADGSKVTTTKFDLLRVIRAKDRPQLDEDNCILLRPATGGKTPGLSQQVATQLPRRSQECKAN